MLIKPKMRTVKVKEIINLTPHKITILDDKDNVMLELPRSDTPARVKVTNERVGTIEFDGKKLPINGLRIEGETENLPEPQDGVIYIVSLIVCRANPSRGDLYVVDELVRDDEGNIVGVRALSRNPFYRDGEQVEDFELHYVDSFNDQLEFGVGVENGEGYVLAANDMGEFRFKISPELAHRLAKEVSSVKNLIPYKNSFNMTEEDYE